MDIDDKRGFGCCCGLVRSLAAMTMIPQSERSQLWLQGPQFPPLGVGGSRRSPSVPPRLLLPRRLPRRAPHTRGRRRAGGGAGAAQHRGRCDPARPGRAPPRGLHKVAGASRRGSRRRRLRGFGGERRGPLPSLGGGRPSASARRAPRGRSGLALGLASAAGRESKPSARSPARETHSAALRGVLCRPPCPRGPGRRGAGEVSRSLGMRRYRGRRNPPPAAFLFFLLSGSE